ncbi:MAG TPA: CGNR zinc finger domain-containing protein [Gaiellales bacterium]|nr:CGNR zinc finger domain-containing protein [Gaiellales bacterium]
MADRNLAPAPLDLVQEFVNTVELSPDGDQDGIATPQELDAWLAGEGFSGPPSSAADVERAREVREGLRRLLEANNGQPPDPGEAAALDRALSGTELRIRFQDGAVHLVAAPGLNAFLAALSDAVLCSQADGTWPNLKACRAESCRWAFYDRSRNHSGVWCSMDDCGSREKVRAYRRRKAASG